jgi:hypothetical protein
MHLFTAGGAKADPSLGRFLDPGIIEHLFTTRGAKADPSLGRFLNPGVIKLGVIFDKISGMSQVYLGELVARDIWLSPKQNVDYLVLSAAQALAKQTRNGQSRIEVRWRTLFADQWDLGKRLARETLSPSVVPPVTEEEEMVLLQEPDLEYRLTFLPGRRLITTRGG